MRALVWIAATPIGVIERQRGAPLQRGLDATARRPP